MVTRAVGVAVGTGVFVGTGALVPVLMPVNGVVVGAMVLSTNRSGVWVGSREYGVAVGRGELTGVGVPRNGMEMGNAVHPDRRERMTKIRTDLFIRPL
jgi:hypothetical protein